MNSALTDTSISQTAANVATLLLAVVIVAQLLLAAGVLPVTMAWGGRQTTLTPALRLASVAAALVLAAFIYVIRSRAGLMGPMPNYIRIAAWVVTALLALNTLGNLASASQAERFIFGPLTAVLTLACLIVAAGRTS